MPVGAGGDALVRIEVALAAEDPALVETFHRWGVSPEDPDDRGVTLVDRRTGLALLFGLLAIGAGTTGILALLLLGGTLFACVVTIRWTERGPASASAG